ncbi:hypothetical protein CRE_17467 [Caenorhabditis remanei]|uniref:DUF38 domain-containing protein n=1 Tax=Caenorhabditis remanei TaxID=31234 RepID=E3N273_CAERE|nr:hypothetical protein CRE_17467 [Caenorhabditis remanei]
MEKQEVLRSKPLSYEASKAVLKSLGLETREAINRRIPALRTINSRLPYVLENVVIGDNYFGTDGRQWIMRPVWVQSSENPLRQVVDPEKSEVTIRQYKSHKIAQYHVNKSPVKIYEQLFDEYIRNGTIVRGSLYKKKRESGEDLKIKVTNLELDKQAAVDYDHLIRFIDLDVLENVMFLALENSVALLDKPEDWITTGREIGTRFTWKTFPSVNALPILEDLKTHFGGVEAGSHLDYYFSNKTIHGNGITLKMEKDRELVMYCYQDKTQSEYHNFPWLFEMEAVASTPATGTVPTTNVLSH